jgi:hypothetical protein
MANTLYPKFKKRAFTTGGNLLAGAVKAVLIDLAAYTYSAAHEFLSDIPAGARIGAAATLAGKTVSDLGVFDADDATYTGLVAAPTIEALAIYVDTGTESTSPLFVFIDTGTGLPIAAGATGGTVVWPNDANRIAAL